MTGRVAVAGGYGTGITIATSAVPGPGETLLAGEARISPGGKGSNQAVAASRLGVEVTLFTAVGDDSFAERAWRLWADEKIDTTAVRTKAGPTMLGVILVDPSGDNRIVVAPGALAALDTADVAPFAARLAGADLCVVSLEIPAEVAAAVLAAAHAAGVRTLLNPAPPAPLPAEVLRRVSILTPNRPEACALTGSPADTPAGVLADRLRDRCDGTIVITLGPEGALVDDGTERYRVPAPAPVRVRDTTGAGDAFTGALAAAVASGVPVREAVRLAVSAGTFSVATAEVVPSLAHRADLPLARLLEGTG
ncbi:ribokinase [Micromonospora cathayae]|uniref:Ribokinase n=1 Tax=Micromonospora cathayae TaxID=3028804 RepID=A0ABY7ZLE0_9ACTN|nr:ribokinase [Micromonospora sp. HUAS 3]WDZ83781.1 ribokinase [Micromonospora sp. HUAS 3]